MQTGEKLVCDCPVAGNPCRHPDQGDRAYERAGAAWRSPGCRILTRCQQSQSAGIAARSRQQTQPAQTSLCSVSPQHWNSAVSGACSDALLRVLAP